MIQTTCIGCQATDDHPKHRTAVGADEVAHHHDCGKAMGCAVCTVLHDEAPKARGAMVTGDKLREHLVTLPPRWWSHHPDGTVTFTETDPADTASKGK